MADRLQALKSGQFHRDDIAQRSKRPVMFYPAPTPGTQARSNHTTNLLLEAFATRLCSANRHAKLERTLDILKHRTLADIDMAQPQTPAIAKILDLVSSRCR
jgi:hypothetical protein